MVILMTTGGLASCSTVSFAQCQDFNTNPISDWGRPTPGDRPSVAWQLLSTSPDSSIEEASEAGATVVGDLALGVYDSCDVIAIDVRTGEPLWTTGTKVGASGRGTTFQDVNGRIIYKGSVELDPVTGERLDDRGDEKYQMTGPVGVRISDGPGTVNLLDVRSGREWSFEAPWKDELVSDLGGHGEIVGDQVLTFVGGRVWAADLETGDLEWTFDPAPHGLQKVVGYAPAAGGVIAACGIVEAEEAGALVRIDVATGELLSVTPMIDPDDEVGTNACGRTVRVGSGVVVLDYIGSVWAFDEQTGDPLWHQLRSSVLSESDTIRESLPFDGRVYSQRDKSLVTYDARTGNVLHTEQVFGASSVPPMLGPDNLLIVYSGGGSFTAFHRELLG